MKKPFAFIIWDVAAAPQCRTNNVVLVVSRLLTFKARGRHETDRTREKLKMEVDAHDLQTPGRKESNLHFN